MPLQNETIFQEYIAKGVNSVDAKDQTALMWAASDPKLLGYVKRLIKFGADINFSRFNKPALLIAAEKGNTVALTALIEAKANLDYQFLDDTALKLAIKNDHTECAKVLMNKKAELNYKRSFMGDTALELAVRKKKYRGCELIIRTKSNNF